MGGTFAVTGERSIQAELDAFGGGHAVLVSGSAFSTRPPAVVTRQDLAAPRQRFPELPAAYLARLPAEFRSDAAGASAVVYLADGDYAAVSGTRLAAGGFWDGASPGIVLGSRLAEALFPDGRALGREVTVSVIGGSVKLPVTGIAAPPRMDTGESLQLRPDSRVMPAGFLPPPPVAEIHLRLGEHGNAILDELVSFMNARHPDSAPFYVRFPSESVRSMAGFLRGERAYLQALTVLIAALAAVANAAFLHAASVAERPLYALQRALGASRRDLGRSLLWVVSAVRWGGAVRDSFSGP